MLPMNPMYDNWQLSRLLLVLSLCCYTLSERIEFKDGRVYQGQIVHGQRNGKGNMTWPSGLIYSGTWRNDTAHGEGFYLYPDGSTYKGSFAIGLRDGLGNITWAQGGSYQGLWMLDDIGSLLSDYDGEYHYPDGKIYKGSLAGGIRDGQGTMIWLDGSRYSGEWLFGVAHGLGTKEYSNRCIYSGGWILGQPGYGEYLCPNGVYFKGDLDGIESFITENGTLSTNKETKVLRHAAIIKGQFERLKSMITNDATRVGHLYFHLIMLASSIFLLIA